MHRRFIAAAVAALLTPAALLAQSDRVVHSETNVWLDATADVWLAPAWGAQGELLYERSDVLAAPMQTEVRLGAQHRIGMARLAVGGTYIHNSPYGIFATRGPSHESRAWEQLAFDTRAGVVSLSHRVRLEERWLTPAQVAGTAPDVLFTLRTRYQLRATVPLTSPSSARPIYAAGSDELFASFGPHRPPNPVDQNRAYVGAGIRWSPAVRAELGYLNQVIVRARGRQLENNHTLQLSLGLTHAARKR